MSTPEQRQRRRALKVTLPPPSGPATKRTATAPRSQTKRQSASRPLTKIAGYLVVAVLALAAIYAIASRPGGQPAADPMMGDRAGGGAAPTDSRFPFQVGTPGPGAAAPSFALGSTDGTTFDLAAQRGQTVMLYFQEGLGCQPCWDQMKAIEQTGMLADVGVDKLVSITTQPLDLLRQKVNDEGIGTPVLADPDLAVSAMYEANKYGMMGDGMDGHSFILIDPKGQVLWRADYGGAPNYSMFIPVEVLRADIEKGLAGADAS